MSALARAVGFSNPRLASLSVATHAIQKAPCRIANGSVIGVTLLVGQMVPHPPPVNAEHRPYLPPTTDPLLRVQGQLNQQFPVPASIWDGNG